MSRQREGKGRLMPGGRLTRSAWLGFGVALLGAGAYLVYLWSVRGDPCFTIPVVDEATYVASAQRLARGADPGNTPFWQPPFYPWLLSLVFRMGGGILAARVAQSVSVVACALLVYAVSLRVMARRWAVVAAVACAVYGPLLFYSSRLLPVGPAAVLNVASVWCVLRLRERPSLPRALLCGCVFGIAALNVPNILVVVPVAACLLILDRESLVELRRRRQHVLAVCAACVLTIAPVTIRNFVVSGEWVPISTNAGINFYIGNSTHMQETVGVRPGQDWDRLTALPFREGATTSSEAQQFFVRSAVREIVASPVAALRNVAMKGVTFWSAVEIPRNISIYSFAQRSPLLGVLIWRLGSFAYPFGMFGALGLCGMCLALRQGGRRSYMAWHVLTYMLSVVLFFPTARYRLPIVPLLLVLGVWFVSHIYSTWRGANGSRRLRYAASVLCGMVFVSLPLHGTSVDAMYDAELLTYTGVGLQVRGDMEGAMAQYAAALASSGAYPDTYYYIGAVHRTRGATAAAERSYRTCLAYRPDHEKARNDLAVLLFESGRIDEAERLLRAVVRDNPLHAGAMRNLAAALATRGHRQEAAQWLARARDVESRRPD